VGSIPITRSILTPTFNPIMADSERSFREGETIIAQGDPAMEAFLILEGAATVHLEKDGQARLLATLHEGEIFGEAALFKGSDYGASVKAASGGARVLVITPPILDEKIKACDPMIRALIRMLMVRLRKTNEAAARAGAD
jgi:CRP-like cAMP-binding protein